MSARDGHRRRVRHACMPRGVTPASRARTSEICRHASRVLDGIDLGGTRIYAAVLDAAGRVVWGRCIAAPVDDCAATVHALADQVGIARIRNDATAVSAASLSCSTRRCERRRASGLVGRRQVFGRCQQADSTA